MCLGNLFWPCELLYLFVPTVSYCHMAHFVCLVDWLAVGEFGLGSLLLYFNNTVIYLGLHLYWEQWIDDAIIYSIVCFILCYFLLCICTFDSKISAVQWADVLAVLQLLQVWKNELTEQLQKVPCFLQNILCLCIIISCIFINPFIVFFSW